MKDNHIKSQLNFGGWFNTKRVASVHLVRNEPDQGYSSTGLNEAGVKAVAMKSAKTLVLIDQLRVNVLLN